MAKERNAGLDTLRGIGILTVVFSHVWFSGPLIRGLFMIALPLFYMLAGCFFKECGSMKELIADKFRRLIIPFFFFSLLGLAVYFIGNCVLLHQPFNAGLFNLLSTDRMYLPYPAALWFFLSIFWCYMMFGAISTATRSNVHRGIACLCIGVGGWILSRHAPLPLSFDTAMSWMPFFYIGNMLPRLNAGRQLLKGKGYIVGLAVTAACATIYLLAGYNTGYCYNLFVGKIPAIILLDLGATLGAINVCCHIGAVPILSYIGRNSLVIFAGHQIFILIIFKILEYFGMYPGGDLMNFALGATSIACSVGAAFLLRKFAPWLIGERRQQPRQRQVGIAIEE